MDSSPLVTPSPEPQRHPLPRHRSYEANNGQSRTIPAGYGRAIGTFQRQDRKCQYAIAQRKKDSGTARTRCASYYGSQEESPEEIEPCRGVVHLGGQGGGSRPSERRHVRQEVGHSTCPKR